MEWWQNVCSVWISDRSGLSLTHVGDVASSPLTGNVKVHHTVLRVRTGPPSCEECALLPVYLLFCLAKKLFKSVKIWWRREKRKKRDTIDNAKQRYLDKLTTIKNTDPYDLAGQDWITDPDALPPFTYPDIVEYLAFGLSAYTLCEFKSYKSLEAHEHFCSFQDLITSRQTARAQSCSQR